MFFALLIVGIVPGIAALWATYAFSTISLKQAIEEGFQEIAHSTAIRLAAAVDNEIDRATRLALVPLHIRQQVLLADEWAQRKSTATTRLQLPREPPLDQHVPSSIAATVRYLEEWAHEPSQYVRVTLVDQQGLVVASTDPRLPHDR